jgi:hypothetical protein
MKVLLIASGNLSPNRELLFVPAGGVRGVKAVAAILAGKDEAFPMVLSDSDDVGKKFAADLRSSLYSSAKERVHELATFADVDHAEIEDMIPVDVMVAAATRMFRGPDEDFSDFYRKGEPIVPQIEQYAKKNSIELDPGWKVDLARYVKARLLKAGSAGIDEATMERWKSLFTALLPETAEKPVE